MPVPQSPEWWRDRLLVRYRDDLQKRLRLKRLYDSDQPSFEPLPHYTQAYNRLIRMARTPWPRLVVDIVAERLAVTGFQIDEADINQTLWSLFGLSRMEMLQSQVYAETINLGTSYVSIWPDDGVPKLAWESAVTVTHEVEPGEPSVVAAALKVWEDTIRGQFRCNLYLPDSIHKWSTDRGPVEPNVALSRATWIDTMAHTGATWKREGEVVPNPYDIVPMIPFLIRPNWNGYGRSDLDDLTQVFTRIENLTTNILLAVELGAFRQRWATGLDVPRDPNTDMPVEPFAVALDRLWISENENTKFGSFEATDITGYLKAVSDSVGQLSAVSRIPVTYFVQNELANPPSAASLEASETGLINKVRERQETLGESWEAVVNLAIKMSNDFPAGTGEGLVRVIWKDPRTRSEAQTLDAATKLNSIGAPWEFVMEFIGYSPDEITRMRAARMADTFERLLNAPTIQQPGQPAPTNQAPAEVVPESEEG